MVGNQFIKEVQQYDKYARWIPEESRRETWEETTDRVITFFQKELEKMGKDPGVIPWDDLREALLARDVLPSMRAIQMAGPAAERDHTHLYNCAYLPLRSIHDLSELLYILMCGTGVGYSVESQNVLQWPKPQPVHDYQPEQKPYIVEDSSIGWAEAFKHALDRSLDGIKPVFDYSRIRPKGAWLKTKGGRASGPEPLQRLLEKTQEIIFAASSEDRRLTSFDIHRLACLAGSVVDVGGVRRAALISLFSSGDDTMLGCKTGDWFLKYPELAKANNSMVAEKEDLGRIFATLSSDGYGEPGIFNRYSDAARGGDWNYGTNPCGEIILRPYQFCNLSIAVARPNDTHESLERKVILATIWGTIQSCMTHFPHLRSQWKANCEEERLLGVDITGGQDCPLLNSRSENLANRLWFLWAKVVPTNIHYASLLGIPRSAAITCNKPSGNSSQLVDCSSGIHARWSQYYVRRITIEPQSPLGNHLASKGIPYVDVGSGWLFEFPVASPEGAVTKDQLSAIDQLEYWLKWQSGWCDHNASATIYVKPSEWPEVEAFVREHWGTIGGLSFLPKDDHLYDNAPYETISRDEYWARVSKLPKELNLGEIREYVDQTTIATDISCVGGLCEI